MSRKFATFRYIAPSAPIGKVNGKMANSDTVVHNQANTTESDTTFYYGFQRNGNQKNFFGYREKARNLSANPYTTDELTNRNLFKQSCDMYYTVKRTQPDKLEIPRQKFKKKKEGYRTLKGYCIGKTRLNNGEWPW